MFKPNALATNQAGLKGIEFIIMIDTQQIMTIQQNTIK